MGQRGPAPTPSRLAALRGNPGNRPRNKREPQPDALTRAPAPPKALDASACKQWRTTVRQLIKLQLLTDLDLPALAIYCQAVSDWTAARKVIKRDGPVLVVKTESGAIKYACRSPHLQVAAAAQKTIQDFGALFGLSPSSRSRIQLPLPLEKTKGAGGKLVGTGGMFSN